MDGRPYAKQSTRFGKGHAFAPPRIKARQQEIAERAAEAWNRDPMEGPVRVDISFAGGTGDLDNMAKLVLDGLQQGAVFTNDRQVHELHLCRVDPSKPNYTFVTVQEIA